MVRPPVRRLLRNSGSREGDPGRRIGIFLLPLVLLLVFLGILGAGCTHPAPVGTPGSGIRASGPDTPDIFLYQNVVNASGIPAAAPGGAGDSPEARISAAVRNATDSANPVTRDYAVSLIPKNHGGAFNLAQICDLWEDVYNRWIYVDDPRGSEYFSPASRTIALGFRGDCDDFAIALAAMIESVGGSARVVTARNGTSGHAYPEVYVGNTSESFEAAAAYIRQRYHVRDVGCHVTTGADGPRYWLNLDWWSSHPGGKFFADEGTRVAYYPDGRWEQVEP